MTLLEQTMTGIALQLDIVVNHFEITPNNGVPSSQTGAKPDHARARSKCADSVWGLRSRASEEVQSHQRLNRQLSAKSPAARAFRVQVETLARNATPLRDVEENLLRIGQEAITNAVKHSGAEHCKDRT